MASFKQSKQTPFRDFLGGAMGKNPPARAGDAARSLAAAKAVRHDDRAREPAPGALQGQKPHEKPARCNGRAHPAGKTRHSCGRARSHRARAHFLPRAAPTSAPRSNPKPASLPGSSPTRRPPRLLLTQDLTRAVPPVWMVLLDPVLSPQATPVSAHTSPPWDASADNSL